MASGPSITLHFCSNAKAYDIIDADFPAGSIVYLKYKAKKGILESIYISEPIVVGNGPSFIYKDNLNAFYNADELINLSEANSLVAVFNNNAVMSLKEKYKNCSIKNCGS
jgi:hypothetical protein